MGLPYAGTRDASWYNSPRTEKPMKVHIATEDNFAACNPHQPLAGEAYKDPRNVPFEMRCERPACKNHYNALDGE